MHSSVVGSTLEPNWTQGCNCDQCAPGGCDPTPLGAGCYSLGTTQETGSGSVLSTAATSPSTCVLGLVAAALTTKVKNKVSSSLVAAALTTIVKNEGLKTCVQNPRAIPCNTCTWASGSSTYNKSEEQRFELRFGRYYPHAVLPPSVVPHHFL
jgi:hypothetical protein